MYFNNLMRLYTLLLLLLLLEYVQIISKNILSVLINPPNVNAYVWIVQGLD